MTAPMPPEWLEMLAYMREFAAGGGVGFVPVTSRWHGSIPIWFDEIEARPDDATLLAFIVERCKK